MQFGDVPVDQSLGAILAHSVAVDGKRLRKGVRLTAAHIAALSQAGVTQIVAAQLDADDCHEDTAAEAIARAIAPDEATVLRCTKPFTGRVNLIADTAGVVMLDVKKVNAINAINPMITVATVPEFHQIDAGGMVATIKIISYAVPQVDVDAACALANGAISIAAPIRKSAGLIITDTPGGPGAKGQQAITDRLARLGISDCTVHLVPHDIENLKQALQDQNAAKVDVILILTASATSDIDDTAPAALRGAGGDVTRFGMPVDPGNLLFLGHLGTTPVIGLPGCARAPALNGADWVLSRVICGIEVRHQDIAAMGVGGLLKEIPTRPMPRSATRKP